MVADLDRLGLVAEVEDREIDLAHSDRSKTPIEPYLADQWFVKMDQLAQSAMDAVTDGRVRIIPSRYAKGYIDWLSEKRDWPVGRQLWWGHRIPVWSRVLSAAQLAEPPEFPHLERLCPDRTVQPVRPELDSRFLPHSSSPGPGEHEATLFTCVAPGHASWEQQIEQAGMVQEDDVLDTWFSSALWPHSTLGWPEQTADLASFYPTSTLVTSRDIITLWVARMVLTGLLNMGEVPFRDVYVHPKILDGDGETMSKTKGNGVDPFDVIEKFGADALRFALVYLTTENQDVRMPVEFECPHCQAHIKQTKKNRVLPRLDCPKCGAAVCHSVGGAGGRQGVAAGGRCQRTVRTGPQFLQQTLERIPVRPAEPGRLLARPGSRRSVGRGRPLDPEPSGNGDRRRDRSTRQVPFRGGRTDPLRLRMGRVLQLLRRDAQGAAAGRCVAPGRPAGPGPHARCPPATAPPLDSVPDRRGLAVAGGGCPRARAPDAASRGRERHDCRVARGRSRNGKMRRSKSVLLGFQAVLGGLREVRSRQNIPPRQPVHFSVQCDAATADQLRAMGPYFKSMARAEAVGWGPDVEPPANAARVGLPGLELFVDLKDLIDVDAEIARKRKEEQKIVAMIAGKEKKLANQQFVSRAPAAVVERERGSLADLQQQLASVQASLVELKKAK